jgi:hypothetical protein
MRNEVSCLPRWPRQVPPTEPRAGADQGATAEGSRAADRLCKTERVDGRESLGRGNITTSPEDL